MSRKMFARNIDWEAQHNILLKQSFKQQTGHALVIKQRDDLLAACEAIAKARKQYLNTNETMQKFGGKVLAICEELVEPAISTTKS